MGSINVFVMSFGGILEMRHHGGIFLVPWLSSIVEVLYDVIFTKCPINFYTCTIGLRHAHKFDMLFRVLKDKKLKFIKPCLLHAYIF